MYNAVEASLLAHGSTLRHSFPREANISNCGEQTKMFKWPEHVPPSSQQQRITIVRQKLPYAQRNDILITPPQKIETKTLYNLTLPPVGELTADLSLQVLTRILETYLAQAGSFSNQITLPEGYSWPEGSHTLTPEEPNFSRPYVAYKWRIWVTAWKFFRESAPHNLRFVSELSLMPADKQEEVTANKENLKEATKLAQFYGSKERAGRKARSLLNALRLMTGSAKTLTRRCKAVNAHHNLDVNRLEELEKALRSVLNYSVTAPNTGASYALKQT